MGPSPVFLIYEIFLNSNYLKMKKKQSFVTNEIILVYNSMRYSQSVIVFFYQTN